MSLPSNFTDIALVLLEEGFFKETTITLELQVMTYEFDD